MVSFDQFSNLVLTDAFERRIVSLPATTTNPKQQTAVTYYADVPLGMFVVRGDSMVLAGEVHSMSNSSLMCQVSLDEFEKHVSTKKALAAAGTDMDDTDWDFDGDLIA